MLLLKLFTIYLFIFQRATQWARMVLTDNLQSGASVPSNDVCGDGWKTNSPNTKFGVCYCCLGSIQTRTDWFNWSSPAACSQIYQKRLKQNFFHYRNVTVIRFRPLEDRRKAHRLDIFFLTVNNSIALPIPNYFLPKQRFTRSFSNDSFIQANCNVWFQKISIPPPQKGWDFPGGRGVNLPNFPLGSRGSP